MRKYAILFLLITSALQPPLKAQVVSETVNFDTYISAADNDFVNRFDNGQGLNQITTNGITGGCLETPLTISWGNDNAVYCSRFKGVIGENYIAGICFKYDTLQLDNTNFDRAASVWMKPAADPNHYLVASVLDSRRIQIVSYSATGMSSVLTLQHGHWYVLLMIADFSGGTLNDQINVNAQVNDLGITGTDPPIPTGFTNTVLHDSILIADTSIEVSITGTRWGGAIYLDEFRFDGYKSYDNCMITGINGKAEGKLDYSLVGNNLNVFSTNGIEHGSVELHTLQGQKIAAGELEEGRWSVGTESFPPGIYLLTFRSNAGISAAKIFLPGQ